MIEIRAINDTITIGILALNTFSEKNRILLKREQEKAGARFLLAQLLDEEDVELNYTEHNKPFLKNRSEHISISHSHDRLAILVNKKESAGIDVELIRDKVVRLKHKFLNGQELNIAGDDVGSLITFWAAKETLYKAYGQKQVDFRKNLFVEEPHGPVINGRIVMNGVERKYRMANEQTGEYKLVYTLNEIK